MRHILVKIVRAIAWVVLVFSIFSAVTLFRIVTSDGVGTLPVSQLVLSVLVQMAIPAATLYFVKSKSNVLDSSGNIISQTTHSLNSKTFLIIALVVIVLCPVLLWLLFFIAAGGPARLLGSV